MLVLLLGLLGLSAAAPLERGVYRFHSELVQGNEQSFSVEASAVVSPLGSSSSSKPLYALYVQDLSLAAGKQRGEQLSSSAELPVLFTRSDDDGLIDRVMLHPDDSLQMRNLKRAMLEALQGPQEASRVTEDVSMGTRSVEYRAQDHEVRGFFRTGDFSSFGSDVGNTRVHGEKVLSFAPSGAFQSSHTTTRVSTLRRGHQLKAVSTSAMEFVSSDVMMIDLYPEAEWVESTLVHEIDPSARADSLKARFPPAAALIATLSGPETNAEEALKARSQLVALLNRDEALVEEVLSFLASRLRDASEGAQLTRLYSTVARLNSPKAQELLASEITRLAQDRTVLPAVLKSLVALSQPSSPMALMDALAGLQVPQPLADLVDLAIGNVAKFLPQEQADGILAPYIARLKASEADVDKVQLLHVLGNAGSNSPLDVIRAFLSDASIQVRSAALANLRSHLHDESVQAQVTEMFADEVNYTSKPMVSTLLNSVKEGMRKRHMGAKFHELLSQISQGKERVEALEEVRELLHRRFGGKHAEGRVPHWKEQEEHQFDARSTTEVWNDASSPLYDLVAPLYQRNEDVLRYPNHTAFMAANQFGPRFVNLKLTSGVFSGSAGSGCLAGDFKIFDKLYTDTEVFGDLTVLGDLQLYVLSYNSKFDSRVYAIINGNTIVDFSIVNDCSEDAFLIYDGEIDILTYESEIALDIGTLVIYADVYAGLLFDAGYKICLLTLSPFVELYLTGEVYMITDVGATVTALGLIRGGLEGDVYLNYRLGPDTQLGSRNNTCQACIGVYYGYNTQTADLGLFYQRREGLSWGPKNIIPISNWAEPGIPFPTPLIEVCS